jgi:glycerophosphoryl diester phosphodiesterase
MWKPLTSQGTTADDTCMSALNTGRPISVAHRAGNHRASLAAALSACVDWVEADLWYSHGRVLARHEKSIWRSPVLYDKWTLRLAERPLLSLPELCEATAGGPELFLDFKGSNGGLPQAVIAQLRAADALDRAAVCGQNWRLLDAVRELEPGLPVFYSLQTARQVFELRNRPAEAPPVVAASVWEGLLTDVFIRELRERDIQIFAWTVNGAERAIQLIQAGVAGIISDRLDLLASLATVEPDQNGGLAGAGMQA